MITKPFLLDENHWCGNSPALVNSTAPLPHFCGFSKEVPYKTYYYNYGLNFLILNYIFKKIPCVHIIQNCKYVDTVDYNSIPQNIIIDKVVDYHGTLLNIHSVDECVEFVEMYKKQK